MSTCIQFEREHSTDSFLRNVLIEMAKTHNAPSDLTGADFSQVRSGEKKAIRCDVHVSLDYTASVGYDRKEEYWDKEKRYNSKTQTYYYEDVKKTRTVTDWRPYSGHIARDKYSYAFNEEACEMKSWEQDELLEDIAKSTLLTRKHLQDGKEDVLDSALDTAKSNCIRLTEKEISYPGDRHKDERIKTSTSVKSVSCMRFPYDEVDYTYKGQTYSAGGFACGNPNIRLKLPPNDVDVEKETAMVVKGAKTRSTIAWFAFFASYALALYMFISAQLGWMCILPIACFAIAILIHKQYQKVFEETLRISKKKNVEAKLAALRASLTKHGFDALTEKEMESFNAEEAASAYATDHKKPGMTGRVWVGIFALLLLLMVIYMTNYFN